MICNSAILQKVPAVVASHLHLQAGYPKQDADAKASAVPPSAEAMLTHCVEQHFIWSRVVYQYQWQ